MTFLGSQRLQDEIMALRGCVALWPCDDRSGSIRDVVGGGGLGTAAGGTTYGRPSIVADGGSSLAFDGAVGSKVTGTGTNLPLGTTTTDFTIMAWLYFLTTPAASTTMFGFGGTWTGSSKKERRMIRFSSKMYFWADNADLAATSADYSVARPQLIAMTNANATLTLSKDGVSVVSGAPGAGGGFATPDIQAWGMSAKTGNFEVTMNGRISHFAIFNRALSLNELRHLSNVAAGT